MIDLQKQCMEAMSLCNFTYSQRVEWHIWAARHQICPSCSQAPYQPCLNLTEMRKGRRKRTRWPHEDRIDWQRFYDGLTQRGYILD